MNISFGATVFDDSSSGTIAGMTDPDYLAQLDRDPRAALRSRGIEVPEETEIVVLRDTDTVLNVLMPPDPNKELDEEALAAVSGGGGSHCASTLLSCICSMSSI